MYSQRVTNFVFFLEDITICGDHIRPHFVMSRDKNILIWKYNNRYEILKNLGSTQDYIWMISYSRITRRGDNRFCICILKLGINCLFVFKLFVCIFRTEFINVHLIKLGKCLTIFSKLKKNRVFRTYSFLL